MRFADDDQGSTGGPEAAEGLGINGASESGRQRLEVCGLDRHDPHDRGSGFVAAAGGHGWTAGAATPQPSRARPARDAEAGSTRTGDASPGILDAARRRRVPADRRSLSVLEGRRAAGGWLALMSALGLALVASGVIPGMSATALGAGPSASPAPASSGSVVEAGRGLYQAQCSTCHGQQGLGTANGPALTQSGAAAADFYLRTGRMPLSAPGQPVTRHEPHLSDDQIRALTAVVASFGNGPQIPQVAGGGDLQAGARLFVANCAACHGATGSGNAVGGGFSAVNLGRATATQIVEAIRIGPGVMPRFAFSQQDESAIVAYVQSLHEMASPGGLELGGFGAVAEGLIAIGVGLVLLVLVAMFVGRRSHEGEPGPGQPK